MTKKLTPKEKNWYFDVIDALGGTAVTVDRAADVVTYNATISSDESHARSADAEELAHAVTIGLLHSADYRYPLSAIGHEIHFAHGSKGSKSDEVDILIKDGDGLPYAIIELKAASEYDKERNDDQGRTASYPTAPSRIPACGIPAQGSSMLFASHNRFTILRKDDRYRALN